MNKKIIVFVLFLSLTTFSNAQKEYKLKKVPSKPLNLQKLSLEIYEELLSVGGEIWIGDRQYFVMDQFDETIFEYTANKSLSRSGAKGCRFYKAPDGIMYFPRNADWEVSKESQGILYTEMKKKWDRYLEEKARKEEKQ